MSWAPLPTRAEVHLCNLTLHNRDIILYMNKIRLLYSILAIGFGVFFVVYGGYDDSPGGQLLGLVVVILGIVGVIKSKKKSG